MRSVSLPLLVLALSAGGTTAQPSVPANWAAEAESYFRVIPNQTYLVADGYELKLDLILPLQGEDASPSPTLVYIHGGGWISGTKESNLMRLMPYLSMGWAVINVEYRLARAALAPGAVEDCRCALRWIRNNAERYDLDVDRLVVTGHSAGGHLSLTTGMLTAGDGFDNRCPQRSPTSAAAVAEEMPVAAIVNWYGITDVPDLVEGENARTYAVAWMGSLPNRSELGEQLSPLNMVRDDLPPILTIHGDADPNVPYDHAVRLHAKLEEAGVANKLHTIPGGGHGRFNAEQTRAAYEVIRGFLARVVPAAAAAGTAAADSGWKAPRNAFGQPDLQGVWANNIATPLERPEALAGRETLTDAELAAIRQRAESLFGLDSDDAAFGDSVFNLALNEAESFTSTDAATGNYNQFWVAERDWDNRTSLIVDPPNGRLPALTDEGEKRAAALRAARNARAAGPEDRSLTERCISFGIPRLRAAYNSYTQIFQGEDHVVLLMELIHDARVVPIDGRPHLPEDVRLWHGDSRGHWEGETLVIETRNFSDTGGYRGATGNLQLVERLTRVGPETLEYVVTLDDPQTWTEPWTVMIPLKKSPDDLFEFACHEGNYGLEGILAGARAEEAALAASR